MSSKSRFLAGLAAILVLVCDIPAFGGKPPVLSYQVIQLDLVDQDNVAYAYSMANDVSSPSQGSRQVVGYVGATADQAIPACWTTSVVDGTVQSELNVLALPTANGLAEGINQYGEIVGVGWDEGQSVGLYWSQYGAEPDVLVPLLGDSGSCAHAINKNGVICGFSESQSGYVRPVLWWVIETGIVGPVELPMSEYAFAVAINDTDAHEWVDVVGMSSADGGVSGVYRAVAWTVQLQVVDGTLEVIALVAVLDENGRPQGVNNAGTVCGASQTTNPLLQAVVWTGGVEQALKGAKFYVTRSADDINDRGVIVGSAEYTRTWPDYRAVMWSSATGSMVLLNQFLDDNLPLTTLSCANAVNNYGEIVGFGYAGPRYRAFLAIPK